MKLSFTRAVVLLSCPFLVAANHKINLRDESYKEREEKGHRELTGILSFFSRDICHKKSNTEYNTESVFFITAMFHVWLMGDKNGRCGDLCVDLCSSSDICQGFEVLNEGSTCTCLEKAKCSDGSCPAAGTCCPGMHPCSDGSCAASGTCCPGMHPCSDGITCVATEACCPGDTKCADGTCIAPALNITCTQITTAKDFFSFIDTVNSTEEAINNINPNLGNDFVEAIRSIVGKDLEALVTPERVISIMFPNPNALFNFSGLHDVNGTGNSSRALATFEGGSRSLGIAQDVILQLRLEGCPLAYLRFATQIVLLIVSAFGFRSPTGADYVAVKIWQIGGPQMLKNMFAFATWGWLDGQKWEATLFVVRFFLYAAKQIGAKELFKAFLIGVQQAPLGEQLVATFSLFLSIIALVVTEGQSAMFLTAAQVGLNIGQLVAVGKDWKSICLPETCAGKPPDAIPCDDGDVCTVETKLCDTTSGVGGWICYQKRIACELGYSCDRSNGFCKPNDDVVPCVAVIDEDSSFGSPDQATLWSQFRADYPSRPFCLLVPGPEGLVRVPQNFKDDNLAGVEYNIIRDNGDPAKATDWFRLCAIDMYSPTNTATMGLFVDDSGSMTVDDVRASYDLLKSNVEQSGIMVQEVVNEDENWILPFLTTLVPTISCTAEGKPGECLLLSKCTGLYKKSVPYELGDPEPSCRRLAGDIQCCVPYSCTAEGQPGDCLPTADCQAFGKKSVPSTSSDPEPSCKTLPTDVQCCI